LAARPRLPAMTTAQPSLLCYTDDSCAGITRRKAGRGWAYYDPQGARITDRAEIDRLNRIGLPPAYKRAWFCADPNGHIQAVGWDDKGRKQYRYHLDHRAQQEAEKYARCVDFGRALPAIRERVDEDLDERGVTRNRAVAAVVRLLDIGHIRVGNDEYAAANESYGATTLQDEHARIRGGRLVLDFIGKSGKHQKLTIEDKRLARVVKKCQDLPGQRLFQFLDEAGEQRSVGSADVNAYLREASGTDFTAKNFRTWGASVIAFEALFAAAGRTPPSLKELLEPVARALGNTPAISRKSYVHPALIDLAKTGRGLPASIELPRATRYLSRAERGLIAFLDQLAAEQEAARAA
jgi:DNA topoisomerase I